MSTNYTPHRSLASIIAIVAAIACFFVHSGLVALLLAVVAILFGLIGFLLSFFGERGGILSFLAIFVGFLGGVVGIFRALYHLGQHL